jgi:phage repressor protein C with HTH and peptisase S24 domain
MEGASGHMEKKKKTTDPNVQPHGDEAVGARIDEACRLIGDRETAAQAAGVSSVMLRRYIRGGSKATFEVIANLARAAKVSLDWIATGEGEMRKEWGGSVPPSVTHDAQTPDGQGSPEKSGEFVFIPRYSAKEAVRSGSGVGMSTAAIAFRRLWIEHYLNADPGELRVLSVRGEPMETVSEDRDFILVNVASRSVSGGMYALSIDGEVIVRHTQRLPGGILEVRGAGETYPSFTVSLADMPEGFSVIGRVVWVGRQV